MPPSRRTRSTKSKVKKVTPSDSEKSEEKDDGFVFLKKTQSMAGKEKGKAENIRKTIGRNLVSEVRTLLNN
jgi:hypothetical protein